MKVSIIGGTGFVGTYIIDALLQAGHTPRVLVRPGSVGKLTAAAQCETVPGDISDTAALDACLQRQGVQHFILMSANATS